MFATYLTLGVTGPLLLLAHLFVHVRVSTRCRRRLRPQAERLLIENLWMERHARRPAEFNARWEARVDQLYRDLVSKPMRATFGAGSFRRALQAEFAAILPKEIESWTFIDRASTSSESYGRLMLRCLKTAGWRVDERGHGYVVLTRDRQRIVACLHWTDREIECLAISAIADAARHLGCRDGFVITNGRFTGAATAMAKQRNVLLLHCSQLDLLPTYPIGRLPTRELGNEGLRWAA